MSFFLSVSILWATNAQNYNPWLVMHRCLSMNGSTLFYSIFHYFIYLHIKKISSRVPLMCQSVKVTLNKDK